MPPRKGPTRQEEMSAESQRRLLDAAVQLFAERGYRETSLQDIGEAGRRDATR
jgi:AcrR family transcriptional regulator